MLKDKKNIHFVGIGGIGMSGLALILLKMGYRISGSDLESNNLTSKIERSGGRVYRGHRASNLKKDVDAIVLSSAVSRDNPELAEGRRRGITVFHRAEVLAALLNAKKGIAVTGTHGKTTTASLISVMLENLKFDPTVAIGGEINCLNGNAKLGRGRYLVAEADESDSSFLHLKPLYAVITNIELEHLDHYKTLDDILAAYLGFANNIKRSGTLFFNKSDINIRRILRGFKGNRVTFGLDRTADLHPADIDMRMFNTSYGCFHKNRLLGRVELKIPGMHNVLNSLAAIGVGLKMGLVFSDIADSLKDFTGAKRRFHLRADTGDVMLIDDYAHHPTEIRAVLEACHNWNGRRFIVIFQPHRYTRTLHLADAFGRCFAGADKLILTDIYAASEEPIEGVSVKNIYDRVKTNGLADVVILAKDKISRYVMKLKRPGDVILVLGAGDIKKVADELSNMLKG